MVVMSGTATVLQQFVSGLKSRNEDTRAKSAKDLQHYVTTELREVGDMHTHTHTSSRPLLEFEVSLNCVRTPCRQACTLLL